jgi:hypothetical protein
VFHSPTGRRGSATCIFTAICRTLGQIPKKKHESDHKLSTSDDQSRTTMGRHIPRERKEVALQMSALLDVKDRIIGRYTGISERSMRCIRKIFWETPGEVVRTPVCAGRPRILDSLDANVSYRLFSVSRLICDFSVS